MCAPRKTPTIAAGSLFSTRRVNKSWLALRAWAGSAQLGPVWNCGRLNGV